jgi:hypothetical protein
VAAISISHAGAQVFGNTTSIAVAKAATTGSTTVDAILGQTPGTAIYGAPPEGHLLTVTGTLTSTSITAVRAQQTALKALANVVGTFSHPSAIEAQESETHPNCYFSASDVSFGAITQSGSNYTCTYALAMRQLSGSP